MRAKFSPNDVEEANQGRLRFDKNQAVELRNAMFASLR
jgi:hypothetical protein